MESEKEISELKAKVENLENEIANFMQTLRIISGDNERLIRKLKTIMKENEWLSETVANHEKRIIELEEMFLIEN